MKKLAFLLFLSLLVLCPAQAAKQGGNGGGLAEKFIMLAYEDLPSYIDFFLEGFSKVSNISDQDRSVLLAIRDHYDEEKLTTDQIRFDSESKHHGEFLIDDKVRVAVTNNAVGGIIYVNTDLLYSENGPKKVASITFPMAVAILIHEFGHHQGIKDCAYLDSLATKVADAYKLKALGGAIMTTDGLLEASYVTSNGNLLLPARTQRLIVTTRDDVFTLNDILEKGKSPCRVGTHLGNYYYTNLSWSNQVKDHSGFNVYTLLIKATIECKSTKTNGETYDDEIILGTSFPYRDKSPRHTLTEILDCQNHPEKCW